MTTKAVRRAIQHSQESLSGRSAVRYGVRLHWRVAFLGKAGRSTGIACHCGAEATQMCIADASGDIIAFHLTGGEASDARHFRRSALDIGPDIQPRAVICDKGYASKAQPRSREEAWYCSRHPAARPTNGQTGFLRQDPGKALLPSSRPLSDASSASNASFFDARSIARNFGSIVSLSRRPMLKFVHHTA